MESVFANNHYHNWTINNKRHRIARLCHVLEQAITRYAEKVYAHLSFKWDVENACVFVWDMETDARSSYEITPGTLERADSELFHIPFLDLSRFERPYTDTNLISREVKSHTHAHTHKHTQCFSILL